jgi:hypothetical protein
MARAKKGDRRDFPRLVFAQASPRSIGPTSLFETDAEVTRDSVAEFTSEAGLPEDRSRSPPTRSSTPSRRSRSTGTCAFRPTSRSG